MAFSYFIANYRQEIDGIANEFERVNGSGRITPEFKFLHSSHRELLWFQQFYQKLRLIMLRNPSLTHHPTETPETTPPTQTTLPSGPSVPTTPPPASTNVVNPQYSSSSDATASSKAESMDEHYTQSIANEFVYGSYQSLLESLNSISWYRGTRYELEHECPR